MIAAADAVHTIASQSAGCWGAILESGCLPALVALLSSQNMRLAVYATGTLQFMAGGSDALGDAHRVAIVAAGCLPLLEALLSRPRLFVDASSAIFTLAAGAIPNIDNLSRADGLAAACSSAVIGTVQRNS